MKLVKIIILSFLVIYTSNVLAELILKDTGWVKSAELKVTLDEMVGGRAFPWKIEGQVVNGFTLYRAEFIPYLKNMKGFYSFWGISNATYKEKTKDYLSQGYVEYFHHQFKDFNGNDVHQVTWVLYDLENSPPE